MEQSNDLRALAADVIDAFAFLGGKDWDDKLVDWAADRFQREAGGAERGAAHRERSDEGDEELAVRAVLGAVATVVELDDEDPAFDHLPVYDFSYAESVADDDEYRRWIDARPEGLVRYQARADLARCDGGALTAAGLRTIGEISGAVESALVGFFGVLRVLLAVLLVPVFAISFLMNMPKLMSQVRRMVPPRNQELASAIVHDLHAALGGWLRGQLTVMLIQAALYSIGLSLAQVPLAVVIGCTAGLLAFVPYVGVSIGLLAALLVALLDVGTRGATPILGVLVTFGSVQVPPPSEVRPVRHTQRPALHITRHQHDPRAGRHHGSASPGRRSAPSWAMPPSPRPSA